MSTRKENATLPDALPDSPLPLVESWLAEATELAVRRNPNAMTIVSVGDQGKPSARIVLCKKFVTDAGYFVFYTNYQSRKAAEFSTNANAAALFHWDTLGRQIRVEGKVVLSPAEESDTYFASRNWGSQLGAWGSDQSAPIASKQVLVEQIQKRGRDLGLELAHGIQAVVEHDVPTISRPAHWGGYRLWASVIELWVEGGDRIHDRGHWSREIDLLEDGSVDTSGWTSTRLQP